jgi:hypothetical protein
MISYNTKVNLFKCNGSWIVSTQQTMNFNIQTIAMIVFFVFDKNVGTNAEPLCVEFCNFVQCYIFVNYLTSAINEWNIKI